jgi:hypothetical protein
MSSSNRSTFNAFMIGVASSVMGGFIVYLLVRDPRVT